MTPLSVQLLPEGGGFAIERGGHKRVVRRKDLCAQLGDVQGLGDRLAEAVVDGDQVRVTLTSGASETLSAGALFGPDKRPAVVVRRARVMTCDGPGVEADALGINDDFSVVASREQILWVGPDSQLSRSGCELAGCPEIDAAGRLLSPGLIDCHAHPIFAGDRADEFALRAAGTGYLDIAAAGGGINATLGPTRAASRDQLAELTAGRLQRAFAAGTTTCEAKSGYDLTVNGELEMLAVARLLDGLLPVDVSPTLLGAHLIAPERKDDRAGYVSDVAEKMVPRAAADGLATAVDVYCDRGAFTREETETILRAGRQAGLHLRAHVGQFSDLGAAELVAELGGLSVDHLEEVSVEGIRALASAGVVAVMLPSACVQLGMKPPPVAALRDAGVRMAVATDMNPGSSKCEILSVPMWLATTHYGMTVEETWLGVTRHAAAALGRNDLGAIAQGMLADMVLWEASSPAAIPYECGRNLARVVIKAGLPYFVSRADTRR